MIRRFDLGFVTPLRSQAIYHGLAAAMDQGSPDTIVFCAPAGPCFCVGYHQNAGEVLDLALCRRRGWPVLRRRLGGGAVYLDERQLFYQAIVHRSRAPFTVERVYATYLAAPRQAHRRRLGRRPREHRTSTGRLDSLHHPARIGPQQPARLGRSRRAPQRAGQ